MGVTYGQARSRAEKLVDEELRERVINGMEALKKKEGENWVEKIDCLLLDLGSPSQCVLGQVYADQAKGHMYGYTYATDVVFYNDEDFDATLYGFEHDNWEGIDYSDLNRAWKTVLCPLTDG